MAICPVLLGGRRFIANQSLRRLFRDSLEPGKAKNQTIEESHAEESVADRNEQLDREQGNRPGRSTHLPDFQRAERLPKTDPRDDAEEGQAHDGADDVGHDVTKCRGELVEQQVVAEQPPLPLDGRVGQNEAYQEEHAAELVRDRLRAIKGVPANGPVGRKETHDDDQYARADDEHLAPPVPVARTMAPSAMPRPPMLASAREKAT